MRIRHYQRDTDLEALLRLWDELGWPKPQSDATLEAFFDAGHTIVGLLDEEIESMAEAASGNMRYLETDLRLAAIMCVGTGYSARRRGLAPRVTAAAVAEAAARGAQIAALGMFEQGFYDRLGFGTGPYEHILSFDPAHLKLRAPARPPRRLGLDDFETIHQSRLHRLRAHGGCNLHPAEISRLEMELAKDGFGLGYFDGNRLSHHLWISRQGAEFGPYRVLWMAFQDGEGFRELMSNVAMLGEQVRLVTVTEPSGIQLQDLIDRPLKHIQVSQESAFEAGVRGFAFWQARICDVESTLKQTRLNTEPFLFNLQLSDPIAGYLPDSAPWRGVTGTYEVQLGAPCSARLGERQDLPTLRASVGAWTRLWLGVRPASGLAITDDLQAPDDLLARLDKAFCLPHPRIDWEF